MNSALFDTNAVRVMFEEDRDSRKVVRGLASMFAEVRCAVVLQELLRGERWHPDRRQRHRRKTVLGPYRSGPRIETPTLKDWQIAGQVLQRIPDQYRTKEGLRKMTNDVLIAAICVRLDLILVSEDQDYEMLRKVKHLNDLRWIQWSTLRQQLLEG